MPGSSEHFLEYVRHFDTLGKIKVQLFYVQLAQNGILSAI